MKRVHSLLYSALGSKSLCLLLVMFNERPPTSSWVKTDCARLFLVSACCGDPLWSVRWLTCIFVLQTRHSCVNIKPGQAEAWPSAITVAACSGTRLFNQQLYFQTSCHRNSVSHNLQHPQCITWVLCCCGSVCLTVDTLCEHNHSRMSFLYHIIPLQRRWFHLKLLSKWLLTCMCSWRSLTFHRVNRRKEPFYII